LESSRPVFASAARDQEGEIILKVVNPGDTPLDVQVELSCSADISPAAKEIVLAGSNPQDQNTFERPNQLRPAESEFTVTGSHFSRRFRPYSLSVLRVGEKRAPIV
jgi:alpha-L-arabinofuranosidase